LYCFGAVLENIGLANSAQKDSFLFSTEIQNADQKSFLARFAGYHDCMPFFILKAGQKTRLNQVNDTLIPPSAYALLYIRI
jgi:hypothetical protein